MWPMTSMLFCKDSQHMMLNVQCTFAMYITGTMNCNTTFIIIHWMDLLWFNLNSKMYALIYLHQHYIIFKYFEVM